MRSVIAGTGSYAPERIVTNAELEKMVETSDQWIVERSELLMSSPMTLAVPSIDLSATFPVKPSVTMTSSSPVRRSRPSQ